MNKLSQKLWETRRNCLKMWFLVSMIDVLIITLLAVLLLLFIGESFLYALVLGMVYFTLKLRELRKEGGRNLVEELCEREPGLDEQLKTAYDNRNQLGSNVILRNLEKQTSHDLKRARLSNLLDSRQLSGRILTAVSICFLILSLNFVQFPATEITTQFQEKALPEALKQFEDATGMNVSSSSGGMGAPEEYEKSETRTKEELNKVGQQGKGKRPGMGAGELPDTGGGAGAASDEDIFGDPTSANIKGENKEMDLKPEYGGSIEITNDERQGETGSLEEDTGEASEMPGQEPVQYQEVIKRYFTSIQEET